jgi:hypothetical protein
MGFDGNVIIFMALIAAWREENAAIRFQSLARRSIDGASNHCPGSHEKENAQEGKSQWRKFAVECATG